MIIQVDLEGTMDAYYSYPEPQTGDEEVLANRARIGAALEGVSTISMPALAAILFPDITEPITPSEAFILMQASDKARRWMPIKAPTSQYPMRGVVGYHSSDRGQ